MIEIVESVILGFGSVREHTPTILMMNVFG